MGPDEKERLGDRALTPDELRRLVRSWTWLTPLAELSGRALVEAVEEGAPPVVAHEALAGALLALADLLEERGR